jgi:hypothetical protein
MEGSKLRSTQLNFDLPCSGLYFFHPSPKMPTSMPVRASFQPSSPRLFFCTRLSCPPGLTTMQITYVCLYLCDFPFDATNIVRTTARFTVAAKGAAPAQGALLGALSALLAFASKFSRYVVQLCPGSDLLG